MQDSRGIGVGKYVFTTRSTQIIAAKKRAALNCFAIKSESLPEGKELLEKLVKKIKAGGGEHTVACWLVGKDAAEQQLKLFMQDSLARAGVEYHYEVCVVFVNHGKDLLVIGKNHIGCETALAEAKKELP